MEFRNPESYSAWGARQTGRSREQDRDDVWGLALLWPQDPHTVWVILAKNPANTVGGRLVVKWIRSNNFTMPNTCFHLLRSLYLVLSASVECRVPSQSVSGQKRTLLVLAAAPAPAAGPPVSVCAKSKLLVWSLLGRVRKCKFSTRPTHEMLSGRELSITQRHSGYNVNTHKTDGVNKVISRLNIFKFNYKSRNFSTRFINGSQ